MKNKIKAKIFTSQPESFSSQLSIVALYLEVAGKFLFLKRNPKSPQGSTWGVPAGKIEKNESPLKAIKRETFEETGVRLEEEEINSFDSLWIEIPNFQYRYYLFYTKKEVRPTMNLNHEHVDYKWISPEETLELKNLILGAQEALEVLLKRKKLKNS